MAPMIDLTVRPRVSPSAVRLNTFRDPQELHGFLPAKHDPDYLWILSELIVDDLTQHWNGGLRRRLGDYRGVFPELFENHSVLQPIADQEYQLRKSAGEMPNPVEYKSEFGIEPPSVVDQLTQTPMPNSTSTLAQVIHPILKRNNSVDESRQTLSTEDEFQTLPDSAFPQVGEFFQGFELKEVIGRGSFAQVYLAEQLGLASRPVVLKITRRLGQEANRLARLQHSNIVPIFSFHATKHWQAICMPYFGRQTLDQIVRQFRESRVLPKTGIELFSTLAQCANPTKTTRNDQATASPADETPVNIKPSEAASRGELRHILSNLKFVDAMVLLTAQIADGLAHAHSLNILHLDLKPANVLLSDHGQPMLLDFNLAFDREREQRNRFGGTLPYMAPEQLIEMIDSRDKFQRGEVPTRRVSLVDARTDLFAVGVMLFELLTGRLPFQNVKPISEHKTDHYRESLELRRTKRPSARALNGDVPIEIEAIIGKLLMPSAADRYPSASALREDLLNFLEQRPLRYVRADSILSRFRKWCARNPKTMSAIVMTAGMTVAGAAGVWGWNQSQARNSAVAQSQVLDFQNRVSSLQIDLAAPPDHPSLSRGLSRLRQEFKNYGIYSGSHPAESDFAKRLTPTLRRQWLGEMHDLAVMAAYAESKRNASRETETHVAQWLEIASACDSTPEKGSAREAILEGIKAIHDGRFTNATTNFETFVKLEPSRASGHFLLGMCQLNQYRFGQATERFRMASALDPTDARAAFNLGLMLQRQRKNAEALESYDEAVRRDSAMSEAYLQRGQIKMAMGRDSEAVADFQAAIDYGGVTFRALSFMTVAYGRLKDEKALLATKEKLAKTAPCTSTDFLARGNARVQEKDYTGALLDFRSASTLNPRYAAAWNNQASVLGDNLKEVDQAISAMDRAIDANPQNGELYLGRAVLHARTGSVQKAHDDVEKGLLTAELPIQTYQAACAYALTSVKNPEDAEKAVELLKRAVRDGYRDLAVLTRDSDLDPIRNRSDVRKLIEAVGSIVH